MKTAHLVMGNNDYEPGAPVRVFADLASAQEFVSKWRAHQAKRPNLMDFPETPDRDPGYAEYNAAVEKWQMRSPAGGDHAYYDSLTIHSMRVFA